MLDNDYEEEQYLFQLVNSTSYKLTKPSWSTCDLQLAGLKEMVSLEQITRQNALTFRDIRLQALQDTPSAFGSTYAKESRLTGDDWLERRYCQMLWMKVVCPWRDGAAEESVSGRPWLISMRLF